MAAAAVPTTICTCVAELLKVSVEVPTVMLVVPFGNLTVGAVELA